MRASDFEERKLSKGEEKEKERIVKGMKKAKGSFKDRYGKDAEAVMYATATKLAKGESVEEGVKRNILYREIGKRLARGQDIDKIKKYYKDIDNKYPGHIEKIVQALKDRNEIPFKVKEEKKNCGCNQDPCITYGKQEDLEEYSFSKKEFLDNEAENLHSENAVELAKKFGTPKEIKQMDDILTRHNKRGHITPEDMETRDALVRKYYSMLEGKKEDEDYEAKLKALLKIQMDPNTAKDPELKKELMKRKAKLLKTKESLQNEIEWKLQEKALAEGYEGAIIHALRQEGINSFFNKGTLYIEDNADMERVEEIVNQTVQIPPEIKPEEDYYKVESKQKPYVSMYRDGNNGKMIYDVLDKNGDSVYKTNDKTLAMAYLKKNYKDISEKAGGNMEGYLNTIDEYVEMLFKSAKDKRDTEIAYRIQNAVDDIRTRELGLKPSLIRAKYNKQIESENQEAGLQGSVTPQTISKQFPGVADKNNLIQALLKMKRGDTNYSRSQMIAAADAFKELLSKDPMDTQKLMMMLKRVKAKEE